MADLKIAINGMVHGDEASGEWHSGPSHGAWRVVCDRLEPQPFYLEMTTTREGIGPSLDIERHEHFDHPMAVLGYLQAFGASL